MRLKLPCQSEVWKGLKDKRTKGKREIPTLFVYLFSEMMKLLVPTRRLSVMHSLRLCCKILCQNLVVHPKCTLGGSTKFHPFISSGGGGVFAEFDAEFKFAKIQNSYVEGGWGGLWNLILSSNLLKSKIPMLRVGEGGGFTEFDAEFKFAKIQNSYVEGGGGGVCRIWCWVQIC